MYLFALKLGWLPSFRLWRRRARYLILPAVTLGVSPLALLARTTRAAVLEVMTADFVRTARSKGMSETRVVSWHVMRNVLVIILTTIGLQFGSLMGQAVVVEKLFSWPASARCWSTASCNATFPPCRAPFSWWCCSS